MEKNRPNFFVVLLGLFLMVLVLPIGWWFSRPFRYHQKGNFRAALRGYRKCMQSKYIPEKNKGLYYFNSGLLFKYYGEQETANGLFEIAKELGIEETPDNHTGDKPFIPKGK